MKWLKHCLFILLCTCTIGATAQSLTATNIVANYTTYTQLTSPQTINGTATLSGAIAVTASLYIRAAGPLTSTTVPTNTIPLSGITVQLTAVNPSLLGLVIPSGIIPLTTTSQSLGTGLLSLSNTTFSLSYVVPSTNLLVPPGTYETTLTYTIANTLNLFPQIVGTSKLQVVISTISGIALQNGGTSAAVNFTTPADYINGVTLTQNNALTAFSNTPYSVTVNTTGISLVNGSNFINASNVNLLATPVPANPLITTPSVTLSLTPKNIITSTATPGTYNFNLQYSTNAGNTAFINNAAGAYTNTLTYTITNP